MSVDTLPIAVSALCTRRGRVVGAVVRIRGGNTVWSNWSACHPQAASCISRTLQWHGHTGKIASSAPVLLDRVAGFQGMIKLLQSLQRSARVEVWPEAVIDCRK